MINKILNLFNSNYKFYDNYDYQKADPQLVRYFRNEYGKEWQSALSQHLYNAKSSSNKKAA